MHSLSHHRSHVWLRGCWPVFGERCLCKSAVKSPTFDLLCIENELSKVKSLFHTHRAFFSLYYTFCCKAFVNIEATGHTLYWKWSFIEGTKLNKFQMGLWLLIIKVSYIWLFERGESTDLSKKSNPNLLLGIFCLGSFAHNSFQSFFFSRVSYIFNRPADPNPLIWGKQIFLISFRDLLRCSIQYCS